MEPLGKWRGIRAIPDGRMAHVDLTTTTVVMVGAR
jgi:hypothetical protein